MILLLIVGVSTKMVAINRVAKSEGVTMNQESNTCTAVGSNNSTVMGFGNCYNNIYYINMQIGTPPRTMGFQFDTGSNIMWIPTTKANATEGFNPKSSSTFTITNNSYSITVWLIIYSMQMVPVLMVTLEAMLLQYQEHLSVKPLRFYGCKAIKVWVIPHKFKDLLEWVLQQLLIF